MAYRERLDISRSKLRSAISNGRSLLTGIDARSAPARRYRDVSDAIAQDLGGHNFLTQSQLHLIRSAAGLVVLREHLDAQVLSDERIDTTEYTRIVNSLRRVLTTLGLERMPRDVTPDLNSYIAKKARRVQPEDDELEENAE